MLLNLFQSFARFVIASIAGLFLLTSYSFAIVVVYCAHQNEFLSVRGQ